MPTEGFIQLGQGIRDCRKQGLTAGLYWRANISQPSTQPDLDAQYPYSYLGVVNPVGTTTMMNITYKRITYKRKSRGDKNGKLKNTMNGSIYTVVAYQTRRKAGMASGRGMDHGTARWLRLLGKENSLWESVAVACNSHSL